MTELELAQKGLHNRHVRFSYQGKILTGVILDINPRQAKSKPTEYLYIPSGNMIEWKNAEQVNDKVKMDRLSQKIDISEIESGEQIINDVAESKLKELINKRVEEEQKKTTVDDMLQQRKEKNEKWFGSLFNQAIEPTVMGIKEALKVSGDTLEIYTNLPNQKLTPSVRVYAQILFYRKGATMQNFGLNVPSLLIECFVYTDKIKISKRLSFSPGPFAQASELWVHDINNQKITDYIVGFVDEMLQQSY